MLGTNGRTRLTGRSAGPDAREGVGLISVSSRVTKPGPSARPQRLPGLRETVRVNVAARRRQLADPAGLSRSVKRRAKKSLGLATVAEALTGAVSVIQRGDSALRLNVHFYVLALDGVYVREEPDAPLVFHPLPAPTVEEVTDVAQRTALRVQKLLARHGRSLASGRVVHDVQGLALEARFRGGRHDVPTLHRSHALARGGHHARRDRTAPREAWPRPSASAQGPSSARSAPASVPQGLSCSTRACKMPRSRPTSILEASPHPQAR